ncbi:peptidoglycan DD-metalloendopeptidase family protein [Foetidibacter luteolus]|uniref:peptidoglycan DD-metalloendopeptidase family protein n=1 Tax=Foetidibacter luteolus TaxID=2608880 RepID=UPI001F403176|nr:peptidoglycan DD-metalloendopeptidase family protein [Foetidibacter luteolus]
MMPHQILAGLLKKNQPSYHPVIPFNPAVDKLLLMNFTATNKNLTDDILNNLPLFSNYISQTLQEAGAVYGIGGYNEHRTIYKRSALFNALQHSASGESQDRRLHLGIDIWGNAGTPVFTPLGGMVHSFAFNNNHGDYGATIILLHQVEGISFYSLYGHLSLNDLQGLNAGQYISRGMQVGRFGLPDENGQWPPHLHFQLIIDMEMKEGDYPGVCAVEEREKYLANCPNPDLVLGMMQYAGKA